MSEHPHHRLHKRVIHRVKQFSRNQWIVVGTVAFFLAVSYFFVFKDLPNPANLANYKVIPLATHIQDRNGKTLYEIYNEQKRTPIKLKQLPPYVYQASIAIEDKDFYRHGGISIFGGIARAIKDIILTRSLQGGSTITQQLVKSALLSPERTIQRKIKEIVLAVWTEKLFSKDQILELYLNQVPYGGSAYGVEEAAKTIYNKPASKLSIDEAALLAGLPQAPSLYSPYLNPEFAKKRRDSVLKSMYEQKYITQKQYEGSLAKPVKVRAPETSIKAPHFVFYVKSQLEKQYGIKTVEEGGLKVVTTLDLDIQEEAEKILKDEIKSLAYLNVGNGAVLVTRPPTGEILSMVGSVDYFATGSGAFNVTTALRQPGSSIKPLNYAVGIDRKLVTAASMFLDVRTCFPSPEKPYCPVNYDGSFHGAVPLRLALANSYNIPAVKILALNGVKEFVSSASAFTITTLKDPDRYGLSLTLGGGEVRMTEMAQAFSAFANLGKPRELNSILKVTDRNGKVLYEFKDPNFKQDVRKPLRDPQMLSIPGKRVISPETSFIISHILLDNFARSQAFGTSSELVIPKRTVSVKTGTTDDKKDNWTIGYTPNFLTAVWVGNNDNTPMNPYLTSGITGAAPIWNQVMSYVLKPQTDIPPRKPANVVGRQVCWNTGAATQNPDGSGASCQTRFEYLIRGTEPVALTTKREMVWVTKDSDKLAREGDPNTELKEKTIMSDAYSRYCVDCAGDQPQPTPTP